MPKVTLENVLTGFQTTERINANNDAIEAFSDNTISRDGTPPNGMLSNLDMNSFRIINTGTPLNNTDAANKLYVDSILSGVEDVGAALLRSDLLNTSDLAKGDALVGVKRNTANSVASTLHAYLGRIYAGAKKDYGAVGDGVANDTTAIQNLLTDNPGSTVVLEPGDYLVTVNSITLPDNTTIIGYGARVFSTTTPGSVITLSTGCAVIGLEIQGSGNSSYAVGGYGIRAIGTDNGAAMAPTYLTGINITDCYIHGFSDTGISLRYIEKYNINSCRIENCGGVGIGALSCRFGRISNNHIQDVTPGTGGGLAYGVFLSKVSSADLIRDPVCLDTVVDGNVVEGVTSWEGLDTHGGIRIVFSNNTIRDCRVGIALVKIDDGGGTNVASTQQCTATGNLINGVTNGTGIVLSGDTAAGLPAKNNTISDNVVLQSGVENNSLEAGIRVTNSEATTITGNVVELCAPNGINIEASNLGFTCVGNVVQDAFSNSLGAARGIAVRSTNNRGVIANNTCIRDNTSAGTVVMTAGVTVDSGTNNIILGPNEVSSCVARYSLTGTGHKTTPTIQSRITNVVANTGVTQVDQAVTFDEAFTTTPSIVCTLDNNSGSAGGRAVVTLVSESASGFTIRISTTNLANFSGNHSYDVHWVAVGR